ncbi:protein kinase domain-containing protein [Streptomyces sp. I05A-00742]|uniref:serine/threonine-protein kinase n=1 Tax=Streptomyces sp. I05A-00742 TaxID=2732853 RepID=UPI001487F881|nr:serine/threonine-protein kinase [Streptomyces sp. I05A-00742]
MPPLRDTGNGPEAEDPEYAGRYRLEGRLGAGGMGVVHLAHSPSGLRLAVKVVHAEYAADPEFRARFRQEVAAARRVSGAFTAPVVDADPDCERPWMATLCIAGPTLAAYIKRNGPLAPDEVRRLAAGLAEALRDIHRAGVVHRDLKPSNVLLSEDGPKVIDFGISRPYDSELRTETGKLVGTPPFMAPEQFQRPREVGPAADVFALASVLVHAAAGRGPFASDSPYLVAYQVVHDEPELEGVPADLVPLIRDCLAKDPELRPTPDVIMSRLPPLPEDARPALPRLPDVPYEPPPRPPRRGLRPPRAEARPPRADTPVTHTGRPPARWRREVEVSPPAQAPAAAPRSRWRRVTWFAVGAVATVALGVGAGWAVRHADTGDEPLQTRATTVGTVWQPWQAPLPGKPPVRGEARPAFCDHSEGALYCSAPGLLATRINSLDGKVVWRREEAGGRAGAAPVAPVVGGGLVQALSPDGRRLSALDPASGARRWARDVSRYVGRVYFAGDTVLLVAEDGTVTAVDARTNKERWRHAIPGYRNPVFSSYGTGPAYAVTPSDNGRRTRIVAVDPLTGRTLWQWTANGSLSVVGARYDGGLYLTASDADNRVSAVVRYDPAARRERRVLLNAPVIASSAVSRRDSVYVLSADGGLLSVDTERGVQLWRVETSVANASALVSDHRRVYFSAADGRLIAVDTSHGELLGQTKPRLARAGQGFPGVLPPPVAARGKVYGSAPDGTVFAVSGREPEHWH